MCFTMLYALCASLCFINSCKGEHFQTHDYISPVSTMLMVPQGQLEEVDVDGDRMCVLCPVSCVLLQKQLKILIPNLCDL